jgi:hypothetical protein
LEGTLLKRDESQAPSPNKLGYNLLQKTKNRKHRPQTNWEGTLLKNKESHAPSPNKFGRNPSQKQTIASTVPKQIWKEPFSKTPNRKHRPQTNLEESQTFASTVRSGRELNISMFLKVLSSNCFNFFIF